MRRPTTPQRQRANAEDSLLVSLGRAGNPEAIDQLIRRYWRLAYTVARRIVRCHEDAEEVAQDAICAAISHLDKLREDAYFPGWFHRIIVNQSLMALRRKNPCSPNPSGPFSERLSRNSNPSPRTPEELVLAAERRAILEKSIGLLPALYSVVFRLCATGGLTVSEIAERLGVSQNTVKIRLHRGRKRLRSEVAGRLGSFGHPVAVSRVGRDGGEAK